MHKERMTQRVLMLVIGVMIAGAACAQDARWLAMWERAQKERPERISSTERIAAPSEPGTPMVIHGRVYAADGVTPLPGVIVFAYQTDRGGLYHERGASDWRLRGWARSDENGRFEFRTIRPGSYPSGRTPSHVHFTVEGPDVPRQWTEELQFGDDPLLSSTKREQSANADRFDSVRPVETREGVQHVAFNIRVTGDGRF